MNQPKRYELLEAAMQEICNLSAVLDATDAPRVSAIHQIAKKACRLTAFPPTATPEFLESFDLIDLNEAIDAAKQLPTTPRKEIQMSIKDKTKALTAAKFTGHVLLFVAVLYAIFLQMHSNEVVERVANDLQAMRLAISQSMQSQQPATADEIASTLQSPDNECAKTYISKSLAAGQPVLKGQILPGYSTNACGMTQALEQQRAASAPRD